MAGISNGWIQEVDGKKWTPKWSYNKDVVVVN